MKTILLIGCIGIVSGIIDILPMIKMKLDKSAIYSAFIFYFIMPFIILNIDFFGMKWWLKGAVINLALATPIIIIVANNDKKSILPMTVMAVVLGTFIGVLGHFII